ncbi:hypothetical protein ABH991_004138 [Bradyrhizobium ottawaense]|uniref:Uncharacterized protein n=2 Tax=Nitrobacteraceae TaxID=41294 RepID=A0ABV4G6U4_9BRAD|nr:hypothetical protein BwSF19_01520 [Bradyrhizobium ottawaense]GMO85906.1 hypothetical protein BwSG10_65650 [Bradyrhizobium ottawaense]GMP10750.1 hypothetical protein BwDG23_65650 [Bradyrhizobium ottawaense]GMP17016.1 hypothetical protein BwSH12_30200 [Bradyrhizobium ottawaense]
MVDETGSGMFRNWRIGSVNGALLAAYFIPAWTIVAFNIIVAPVHGLYERPSVAVALFLSDHLQMAGMSTVRAAWLLALGRLTVVAFFAIYLALLCVPRTRKSGGSDEALGIALAIGSLISFASMVMASKVGEMAALRLHATELLLLLGAAIVILIERPDAAPQSVETPAEIPASLGLEQAELLHNR